MTDISLPHWKFILDIVQLGFTVGIGIYVWVLQKHKANLARIERLEDDTKGEIGELRDRQTQIETKLSLMPDSRQSASNIHKRLDAQAQDVHKMMGAMQGLRDDIQTIKSILMKSNK